MERQGRYVGCEMEGGTHSQGHLHTPGSEGLHPGEGRQAKEGCLHPGSEGTG